MLNLQQLFSKQQPSAPVVYMFFIVSLQSLGFSFADPSALYQSPQDLLLSMQYDVLIKLEEAGPRSSIEYLQLDSYYVPESLGKYQQVLNFSTDKEGFMSSQEKNSLLFHKYEFEQSDLESNSLQISSNYLLRSTPHYPKIFSKQKFPIVERSDSQFIPYLEFSDKINTNNALQEKAFELARGEDDVYVIASKIANWVQQEIEYDLSTIFENPEQSATEVFESRQGVCTELSIIFASMMRTLGIPTKITTGYAYTTSEEIIDLVGSNWGGHAWTEVYINGKWVPFDLTYQQYGFVDSSHIIFQQNSDIEELGVQVEMSAYNYEIVQNSLQTAFNFNIESMSEISSSFETVESSLSVEENVVSSGSHILVEATIKNPEEYYQTIPFDLIFPKNVEAITPTKHILSLKPNDEKTIQYILQMPESMNGYSFPIILYTRSNQINETSVTTSSTANSYSYDELEALLNDDNFYNSSDYDETNRVSILNDVGNYTNNTGNLSLDLEDIDFNSLCGLSREDSQFYLQCNISQFSSSEEVLSLDLCSIQNCETLVFSEGTPTNTIKVSAIRNPTFSLGVKANGVYEEETFTVKIPEPSDLNLTYEEGQEYLDIRSYMGDDDVFHEVEVRVDNTQLVLDNTQKRQVINLEPGNYTMIVTQYHFNEEINYQEVDIQIKKQDSLFQKILNFFTSLSLF